MKTTLHNNHLLVSQENLSFDDFVEKFAADYGFYKENNIVLDLNKSLNLTIKDLTRFEKIAAQHHKEKKSFVIVYEDLNFNDLPETLVTVPTLQEAKDLIEMEEIERDLGF